MRTQAIMTHLVLILCVGAMVAMSAGQSLLEGEPEDKRVLKIEQDPMLAPGGRQSRHSDLGLLDTIIGPRYYNPYPTTPATTTLATATTETTIPEKTTPETTTPETTTPETTTPETTTPETTTPETTTPETTTAATPGPPPDPCRSPECTFASTIPASGDPEDCAKLYACNKNDEVDHLDCLPGHFWCKEFCSCRPQASCHELCS